MNTMTKTPQSSEEHWFGFAASLRLHCDADYIALRLLAYTEPNAVAPTMYRMMVEVIEKSLKFFLTVRRQSNSAFSEAKDFGYNIQKLLDEAGKYEPLFKDQDVQKSGKWFTDKQGKFLHHLRYGSGDTQSTPRPVNLGEELRAVDKIFINSILLLPKMDCDLFLGGSLLRTLVSNTFPNQYPNRELTLSALQRDNTYFSTFCVRCATYEEEAQKHIQAFKEESNKGLAA